MSHSEAEVILDEISNNGIAYLNTGDIVDIFVSVTRVGIDDISVPNLKKCLDKMFQGGKIMTK